MYKLATKIIIVEFSMKCLDLVGPFELTEFDGIAFTRSRCELSLRSIRGTGSLLCARGL